MIIYKLTRKLNSKSYIGQTKGTLENRVKGHIRHRRGKSAISAALNKYKPKTFKKEILLYCEPEEADYYEELLIEKFNTKAPNGYNLVVGGSSKRGYNHTPEAKEKIRLSSLGRGHTEESRKKISETHIGMKHSEESKKKISENRKGKRVGKDHPMYGKSHTDETKKKCGESFKGQRHTKEAKHRISQASIEMWNKRRATAFPGLIA